MKAGPLRWASEHVHSQEYTPRCQRPPGGLSRVGFWKRRGKKCRSISFRNHQVTSERKNFFLVGVPLTFNRASSDNAAPADASTQTADAVPICAAWPTRQSLDYSLARPISRGSQSSRCRPTDSATRLRALIAHRLQTAREGISIKEQRFGGKRQARRHCCHFHEYTFRQLKWICFILSCRRKVRFYSREGNSPDISSGPAKPKSCGGSSKARARLSRGGCGRAWRGQGGLAADRELKDGR